MCSCETNYELACARRKQLWGLYHQWYDHATARLKRKMDLKLIFKDYPDILKGLVEGKQIKVLLYAKLREESRLRLECSQRIEWHRRFNSFGNVFYVKTKVSPTFLFSRVSEYLGKEV